VNYYLGPWRWIVDGSESYWAPPVGFSALDLRPLHEQSVSGGTPGLGIFAGTGNPGKDYAQLGSGAWHQIKSSQRLRDMLPGKHRPQGDDLLGMILDLFTVGADPDGIDGPKPILPTSRGYIELHCGGLSHYERFAWGDKYTPKVKDLLRRDFANTMAAAHLGKLKDAEHHRRVLDAQCDKYRVPDWREFVPPELQADVPGRLKHETTITDDFTRADGTTIGNLLTWTEVIRDWATVSNRAVNTSGLNGGRARAESDLSSSDHYAQCVINPVPAGNNNGPITRYASAADTGYLYIRDGRLFKCVTGSLTAIATGGSAAALDSVLRLTSNGSSHQGFDDGVSAIGPATDTAISGNLRCGVYADNNYGVDDFEASDLAASGLLFTQLERSTRGVCRGMFTKW
jgi:hypothetical protein